MLKIRVPRRPQVVEPEVLRGKVSLPSLRYMMFGWASNYRVETQFAPGLPHDFTFWANVLEGYDDAVFVTVVKPINASVEVTTILLVDGNEIARTYSVVHPEVGETLVLRRIGKLTPGYHTVAIRLEVSSTVVMFVSAFFSYGKMVNKYSFYIEPPGINEFRYGFDVNVYFSATEFIYRDGVVYGDLRTKDREIYSMFFNAGYRFFARELPYEIEFINNVIVYGYSYETYAVIDLPYDGTLLFLFMLTPFPDDMYIFITKRRWIKIWEDDSSVIVLPFNVDIDKDLYIKVRYTILRDGDDDIE